MLCLSFGISTRNNMQSKSKQDILTEADFKLFKSTSSIDVSANATNSESNNKLFMTLHIILISIFYLISIINFFVTLSIHRKKNGNIHFTKFSKRQRKKFLWDYIVIENGLWILTYSIIAIAEMDMFIDNTFLFTVFISFMVCVQLINIWNYFSKRRLLPAKIKTVWNNDIYYIYAKEGTSLLAGKNMYQLRCKEFYLIDTKELKEPLVDIKTVLEIPEKKSTQEEYLTKELFNIQNEIQQTRLIIQEKYSKKPDNFFQYIKNYFLNIF